MEECVDVFQVALTRHNEICIEEFGNTIKLIDVELMLNVIQSDATEVVKGEPSQQERVLCSHFFVRCKISPKGQVIATLKIKKKKSPIGQANM